MSRRRLAAAVARPARDLLTLATMFSQRRRVELAILIVVTATAALLYGWLYRHVALARGPLGWDESDHVLWARSFADAFRAASPRALFAAVNRSAYHPFGFSLLLGAVFVVTGVSKAVALALTAAASVAAVALVYRSAAALAPAESGWLAGLVAAALYAASFFYVEFAVTSMLETIAVVATLTVLRLYVRDWTRAERSLWTLSCALAGLLLYKYNYGWFALATICLCQATLRGAWNPLSKQNLTLWPLPLATVGAFVATGGRLHLFARYAADGAGFSSGIPVFTVRNLLFYPGAFLTSYSSSPAMTLACVVGILYGFVACARARVYLVYAGVVWLAMLIFPVKEPRMIATALPALFVLAGLAVADGAARLAARYGERRGVIFGGALIVVAAIAWPIPRIYGRESRGLLSSRRPSWSSFSFAGAELSAVADFIAGNIGGRPVVLVGGFNHVSPAFVALRLGARGRDGYPPLYDAFVPHKRPSMTPIADVDVVVVTVWPTSRYYDDDYRIHILPTVRAVAPLIAATASNRPLRRDFPDAGVTVSIFRVRGQRGLELSAAEGVFTVAPPGAAAAGD